MFEKIIRRAGLEPWPKPFHAMRASCETDLIEQGTPIQTVAKWLGHSPKVALTSYLRVLPEHFERAVRGDKTGESGALQKAVQQALAGGRTQPQETSDTPVNARQCGWTRSRATGQTDGEGFEPPLDLRPEQFSRLPP